ncbi:hypothetical protein [Sphingomonas fuzhouensis]|uniref:hypothetical protein n=1 Tax=Sphingomonas fuzhouensis TaxID=3106033 RepID=UPI002AFFD272|nr:hypothetical protein [Sphingomonas sp. SGZ-02]
MPDVDRRIWQAYPSDMTRNRPWRKALIALFVAIVAFTGYHAVRTVSDAIYWNAHRDEPIEPWMTIGYVAHSYHVPPHILHAALNMPPEPDRRPLARISRDSGLSMAQIEAKLTHAIVHVRPPYPPPGPPPPPTMPSRSSSPAK